MKKIIENFSVIGVLKSILQIFFGLFLFDRFAITINTVIGILLSLCAGTMFSYFEYMDKHKRPLTCTNHADSEQHIHHSTNSCLVNQNMSKDSEKLVPHFRY